MTSCYTKSHASLLTAIPRRVCRYFLYLNNVSGRINIFLLIDFALSHF